MLENASSKSSWTIASPETDSDCRVFALDFFFKVHLSWVVCNGEDGSEESPWTGVLKPLAVSFTVKEENPHKKD